MVECKDHVHEFPEESFVSGLTLQEVNNPNSSSVLKSFSNGEDNYYCFENTYVHQHLDNGNTDYIKIKFDTLMTPEGTESITNANIIIQDDISKLIGGINIPKSGDEDCQPYHSFYNSVCQKPGKGCEFIALKPNPQSEFLYIPAISFIDLANSNHQKGELVAHYIKVNQRQLDTLNYNLKKFITSFDDIERLKHLVGGGVGSMKQDEVINNMYYHDYSEISLFYCDNGMPIIIHDYDAALISFISE